MARPERSEGRGEHGKNSPRPSLRSGTCHLDPQDPENRGARPKWKAVRPCAPLAPREGCLTSVALNDKCYWTPELCLKNARGVQVEAESPKRGAESPGTQRAFSKEWLGCPMVSTQRKGTNSGSVQYTSTAENTTLPLVSYIRWHPDPQDHESRSGRPCGPVLLSLREREPHAEREEHELPHERRTQRQVPLDTRAMP